MSNSNDKETTGGLLDNDMQYHVQLKNGDISDFLEIILRNVR